MDPLRVAEQYFEAWNRRDAAAIQAAFAPGGRYTDPLAPGLVGEAIGAYAAGLWEAFPDLSFDIDGPTLVGEGLVAARWTMRGTNTGPFQGLPPTGRTVVLPGADFITVEGDRVRAVEGYFDAGVVPRALGLQVIVQPVALGPFVFGTSVALPGTTAEPPGAFSITSLEARDETELETIRNLSREIAVGASALPGFMGFTGMVLGRRMVTVTAWRDEQAPRGLMKLAGHGEAARRFFAASQFGTNGFTSVWLPARIGPWRQRCSACGQLVTREGPEAPCPCGAALPAPPPYW